MTMSVLSPWLQVLPRSDTNTTRAAIRSCNPITIRPADLREAYRVTHRSAAYNALGKLIEEAYFDVDDRPTLSVDRYAKVRWKYDNRSNKTEEAYFGIDDRPTRSKQGYLKIVWVYDALGNVIDTQHVTAQADEPIQREHSAVDNAVRQ